MLTKRENKFCEFIHITNVYGELTLCQKKFIYAFMKLILNSEEEAWHATVPGVAKSRT